MWKNAGLIVAVLAIVLSVGQAYAGCGADGCKPAAAAQCASTEGGCVVTAALAKMDLTDEQKKVIAAAQEECAAALAKTSEIKCPKSCAKAQGGAKAACLAKVKAVLTEEQQKALAEAVPSGKCTKGACPSGK